MKERRMGTQLFNKNPFKTILRVLKRNKKTTKKAHKRIRNTAILGATPKGHASSRVRVIKK
jgi:hypothetical protein